MKINSGKIVVLAICCLCSMRSMKAMDRRTDEIAAWLNDLKSRGIGPSVIVVPSGARRSGAFEVVRPSRVRPSESASAVEKFTREVPVGPSINGEVGFASIQGSSAGASRDVCRILPVPERPQPAATVETHVASLRPLSYGATDVPGAGDTRRPDPLLRSGWHNGISVAPAASADCWRMSCECCDCHECLARCVAQYSSNSWCVRAMKHFPFGCALCCCLCMDDDGHAIPITFFFERSGCSSAYDRHDILGDQVCEYLTCGGIGLTILATLAMAGVIG